MCIEFANQQLKEIPYKKKKKKRYMNKTFSSISLVPVLDLCAGTSRCCWSFSEPGV